MELFRVRKILLLALLLVPLIVWAAAATLNGSGNWSNSDIWDSGNIADDISEDVDWNNNIGEVIIQNSESYTTSNQSMNNGNTLTINYGGLLTIGASGNAQNLSTANTAIINVDGDLIIWGDLDVGNDLTLNVTGTLTIKGDINMGNGGALDISGNVTVEGDFNGGNNTIVNVDGTLDVTGTIDTGNGSELTGSGTVTSSDCTGDPDFCMGAPLPIELVSFSGCPKSSGIVLNWKTANEEFFDYFMIQKSSDALTFTDIGKVNGKGSELGSVSNNYIFEDENPFHGINYYRLKAIDLDGIFEYHKTISVHYSYKPNTIMISYPNPITNSEFTIWTNTPTDHAIIELFNCDGQLVYHGGLQNQVQKINPGIEKPGIYILKLTCKNTTLFNRLIFK